MVAQGLGLVSKCICFSDLPDAERMLTVSTPGTVNTACIQDGVSKTNLMPARMPEEVAAEIIRDEMIWLPYYSLY